MQRERHGARARPRNESGFTLIELMVVVLIIAILIAVLIPVFLGASNRARDRAAQSDLRNGLTAEKTIYTDSQTYSVDTSTAGLKGVESSLKWGTAPTVATGDSSVATTGQPDMVCLSQKSKSGTTFVIADIAAGPSAGTYFGKGTGACGTMTEAALSALGGSW
jgi:type IV pilus assembly protein PilA